MTLEQIELLTIESEHEYLVDKILLEHDDLTAETIPLDMLDTYFEAHIEALKAEYYYNAAVNTYNVIKPTEAELTGSETVEEIRALIEDIELANALRSYDLLELIYAEKPEIQEGLNSTQVMDRINSLLMQDEYLAEEIRKKDLLNRFNAIDSRDIHESVKLAYKRIANIKYFKNVTLIGNDTKNVFTPEIAEQFMSDLENEAVNVKELRQAKELDDLRESYAAITMARCNDAIKYIIKHNQTQYSLNLIDDAGLDTLEITFADIFTALKGYRPKKAGGYILNANFNGTIYTETERTNILNILQGK